MAGVTELSVCPRPVQHGHPVAVTLLPASDQHRGVKAQPSPAARGGEHVAGHGEGPGLSPRPFRSPMPLPGLVLVAVRSGAGSPARAAVGLPAVGAPLAPLHGSVLRAEATALSPPPSAARPALPAHSAPQPGDNHSSDPGREGKGRGELQPARAFLGGEVRLFRNDQAFFQSRQHLKL